MPHNPAATLATQRVLHARPAQVFAAFQQPELLAQWWGPAGFTNTFEQFDFVPGGRWVFVMHGPDGKNHHNENVFRAIEPGALVVIEHVLAPLFTLTVRLAPHGDQDTHLTWEQAFESAEMADKLRDFVTQANEQNLDRLEAVLRG
ncbi:MAG: SRPBCC domain-containing protein [Acidovorax sp.]|uniref:SRPBCC domain-containing protein n=1 Tax=Acidovorax sp. TaxID=1872122 RepID=UPI00391AE19B